MTATLLVVVFVDLNVECHSALGTLNQSEESIYRKYRVSSLYISYKKQTTRIDHNSDLPLLGVLLTRSDFDDSKKDKNKSTNR